LKSAAANLSSSFVLRRAAANLIAHEASKTLDSGWRPMLRFVIKGHHRGRQNRNK
jgi:hypothetical protein